METSTAADDLFRRAGDWERLAALRRAYLEADVQPWRDERDLWLYHRSFGERIRWKWSAVLSEPAVADLPPTSGPVVDLGCGTGVASLAVLGAGAVEPGATWHVVDASALARRFAAARLVEQGAIARADGTPPKGEIGTLVASHVLTEFDPSAMDELVALATRSQRVLIVEPGTRAASQAIVELRERLRAESGLTPVAPCPHSVACGLAPLGRAAGASSWCHHFAPAPNEAFTSRFWREYSERLGIDLRALPMSFLVLDRTTSAADEAPTGDGTRGEPVRVLGRPRWEKGRARFDLCTAHGVLDADLLKRTAPDVHRALREPEQTPQAYRVALGPIEGNAVRVTRVGDSE